MKLHLVFSLCFFLVHISLGRMLSKRFVDNSFNLEYRANRGVTYNESPSSPPAGGQAGSDSKDPPRGSSQNLNYDIFEIPDERAGGARGPVRPAPGSGQPSGAQLPPKYGPVLFPDEEAAAQNNGTGGQSEKDVQEGQNQDPKSPSTVTNTPQRHENNPGNGNQNPGRGNSAGHRGRNPPNRKGNTRPNAPSNNNGNNGHNGNHSDNSNGDRNRNNGNGNNGRGNERKKCSFPVDMIFCFLG